MPQAGAASFSVVFEANTDSFLASFADPQCGQRVPCQRVERTNISLSFSHCVQWNS